MINCFHSYQIGFSVKLKLLNTFVWLTMSKSLKKIINVNLLICLAYSLCLYITALPVIANNHLIEMNGVLVNNTLSLLKTVSSTQTSRPAIFEYFRLCMDICLDYGYAVEQPMPVISYLMNVENPRTSLFICVIFNE